MDRICEKLKGKVMSAQEACRIIKTGMTIGMSGFTLVGYPKAVPVALAESGHARELSLCIGASVGDDVDGALVRAGLVKKRFSYQSNKSMREAINKGQVAYNDFHLSHFPEHINNASGQPIDVAIVECSAVTDRGIVLTASASCADALVRNAKQIILEVNLSLPEELAGMHDIFEVGVPPHSRIIPICRPDDRVGTAWLDYCEERIAAIVITDKADPPNVFKSVTEQSRRIGKNIVSFLEGEVAAGRLPENFGPLQSGVGSVGNAVLESLADSGLKGLSMYTEVMQSGALKLLEMGVCDFISTCAISLDEQARDNFYRNIDTYSKKIIIRPQEISNSPEVIRRLGVIALNTPIEVDIYGNVNSTHLMGSRIMNGIGGSGDFTRNARISVFATESIARNGDISCIVPMVSHVDHTEHDVQVIVTEQGVADLRWKSPSERAELIINNCAHPDYREQLMEYYRHAKEVSYGKHTPHDLAKALSWHQRYIDTGSMKF